MCAVLRAFSAGANALIYCLPAFAHGSGRGEGGRQAGTATGKEQPGRQAATLLLEREKDASALINVLLGNQNEFVAWRSQKDTSTARQTDSKRS